MNNPSLRESGEILDRFPCIVFSSLICTPVFKESGHRESEVKVFFSFFPNPKQRVHERGGSREDSEKCDANLNLEVISHRDSENLSMIRRRYLNNVAMSKSCGQR